MRPPPTHRPSASFGLCAAAILAGAAACGGRSYLLDAGDGVDGTAPNPTRDAAPAPDRPAEKAPDIATGCEPTAESCNGLDDDCDGVVDDGIAPIACAAGGTRYCIAGKMSECPRRCEVCLPGSRRVCFVSYCTYWGEQVCAADGRSFGPCREELVPKECSKIASDKKRSRELEECCLAAGYCCVDEFDLDGDGDRAEMLGRCESVTCAP